MLACDTTTCQIRISGIPAIDKPIGSATPSSRPYGGVSAGERLSVRRQKLLDAGIELFGTRGIAATSIGDVCDQAGLTKRYFYESFQTIDQLAVAVFDQVTGRLAARIIPAIIAGGGRDPRPALTAHANAVLGDPRIIRFLAIEGRTAALAEQRAGFARRAVELWFSYTTGPDEVVDPALRLRAYAFAGAISEIGLASVQGELDLTPEQVIDELVDLFHRISGIVPDRA
ncbi:MAG: TetR/AcrR family transcriptional regulator [Solirubrobacteraceae bacterium]